MAVNLLPRDGAVNLFENAVDTGEGQLLLERLLAEVDWRQEWLQVMGKRIAVPRLTAWYGDEGYRYSGIDHAPRRWSEPLLKLKNIAEACAGEAFNGVLLNLYRDGRDSVSWHADDEAELGRHPVIASVSLGGTRRFVLKHRGDGTRVALDLGDGCCLVMAGATQEYWVHCVPKTRCGVQPRVNLTFRAIAVAR